MVRILASLAVSFLPWLHPPPVTAGSVLTAVCPFVIRMAQKVTGRFSWNLEKRIDCVNQRRGDEILEVYCRVIWYG